MRKRDFIKTLSAMLSGGFFSSFMTSCSSNNADSRRMNWAGNLTYRAPILDEPNTIDQAREAVRRAGKLRALGSRHCFNTIADSRYSQITLQNQNRQLSLDGDRRTVTVESGIRYGDLAPELHVRGYALHNLASLPHISIAGACATATHGSGVGNGNLATAISGMELIKADGETVSLTREKDGEVFNGAVVGLGALGVVTQLTLDIEPAYDMVQHVYLNLPVSALLDDFDGIMSSGYSVSLFTDYQSDTVNQVWIKDKVSDSAKRSAPTEFRGASLADRDVHPIIEISAVNCTEQMGVPGPWYERLPHFKMDFTPSSGTELQTEYFVPREHGAAAYAAIQALASKIAPLLMISEVRAVAGDDLWMSTCYGRDSIVFHFTMEQDWNHLKRLLPEIESALAPFDARPHWGKMFTLNPRTLQSRYPRMSDFKALVREFDPQGKFRNEFLNTTIFAS